MLVLRLSSLCRQCPTIGTAARQSLGRPITRRLFTPSKIGAGGDGSRLKQFDWIVKRFKAVDAGATAQQLTRGQEKVIGYWFASVAGLTFATVCAGGLTRLTESGLSMVDWHPFKEVPPSTADQWQAEFEKYQQYPEWKVKNRDITLEQFKFIWHMEYGHRTLGRIIGAVYFLPMAFFWFVYLFHYEHSTNIELINYLQVSRMVQSWFKDSFKHIWHYTRPARSARLVHG